MKITIILALFVIAGKSYGYDPKKCFKVITQYSIFFDYDFPGHLSGEYLTKKYGSTGATTEGSWQNSSSLIDPSVTTGRLVSSAQFSSSFGGCDYFGQLQRERVEYLARYQGSILEQVAIGRGAHLQALYLYNSCLDGGMTAFRQLLQQNYQSLRKYEPVKMDREIRHLIRSSTDMLGLCPVG